MKTSIILKAFVSFIMLLCFSCTKPEKACFDYFPHNPATGTIVTFNASCSEHTYSYKWTFGDGSLDTNTTSTTVTHIYGASGTYNVTLNAERKDGMSIKQGKTTVTKTISVQ